KGKQAEQSIIIIMHRSQQPPKCHHIYRLTPDSHHNLYITTIAINITETKTLTTTREPRPRSRSLNGGGTPGGGRRRKRVGRWLAAGRGRRRRRWGSGPEHRRRRLLRPGRRRQPRQRGKPRGICLLSPPLPDEALFLEIGFRAGRGAGAEREERKRVRETG
ncbi:unnamed protein product, partial [Musa acuminata var. zebrina]